MTEINDKRLFSIISNLLNKLEKNEDIIICSVDKDTLTQKIYDEISIFLPNTSLSNNELSGLRALLLEAISDKRFFDWEKPTLTGFNAEQFKKIAEKLPRE